MAVLRPRTRLVYFRVSEEEFQQLDNLCRAGAARSLSDLVRAVMQKMIVEGGVAPQSNVATELRTLNQNVLELTEKIKQLTLLAKGNGDFPRTACGSENPGDENAPGATNGEKV
jgi:hypothetical protein